MTSAANNQAYGPNWGPSNWGPPNWTNAQSGGGDNGGGYHPGWNGWGNHYWGMMPPWMHPYAARPIFIVAMILGFVFWWPVGLVLLGVMLWNRRMFCGHRRRGGGWQQQGPGSPPWAGWKTWSGGASPPPSGNSAFDEYRAETLRRLEEEQKEFGDYLNRLRVAKDKAEFDQFMNDRRNRPATPPEQPPQA
jgi:hypothetical protein